MIKHVSKYIVDKGSESSSGYWSTQTALQGTQNGLKWSSIHPPPEFLQDHNRSADLV